MNFEGALKLIKKAIEVEDAEDIQSKLEAVRDKLDYIISSPAEPSYQTGFVKDLGELRAALVHVTRVLTPVEEAKLFKLAKGDDFSPLLADAIQENVNANAATLAVAREAVQTLVQNREKTIKHFEAILSAADYLSWEDDEPHVMPAEAGFLVPRHIFNNAFSGLIQEFNFIKRFVALLAEASGEEDTRVELVALSTTDPMVTIGIALGIASLIGGASTWALNSWKTVEEIREIRTRTKKLASFTDEEVEKIFGDKIRGEVEAKVAQEAARLTSGMKTGARKNEVKNGLEIHLRDFLARVERGMTVEVKLIAGAEKEIEEMDDLSATVSTFSHSLKFPVANGDPIFSIAPPNGDDANLK